MVGGRKNGLLTLNADYYCHVFEFYILENVYGDHRRAVMNIVFILPNR